VGHAFLREKADTDQGSKPGPRSMHFWRSSSSRRSSGFLSAGVSWCPRREPFPGATSRPRPRAAIRRWRAPMITLRQLAALAALTLLAAAARGCPTNILKYGATMTESAASSDDVPLRDLVRRAGPHRVRPGPGRPARAQLCGPRW
jgi:hypothetical protein